MLIVRGDAAATANNVRDSELLLRLGMAGELFSSTIVIFAMFAFYHLFKAVSQKHAMAMMILMLISVPISYLNVLNDLAALTFARGPEFLSAVFDKAQLDAFRLVLPPFTQPGVYPGSNLLGPLALSLRHRRHAIQFYPALCRYRYDHCGLRLRDQFLGLSFSARVRAAHWRPRHDSRSWGARVLLAVDLGSKRATSGSCSRDLLTR